jgi:NADPH-dependent 2,4-dienoyl-CoA reductase/sulfur reductase-like enzyme
MRYSESYLISLERKMKIYDYLILGGGMTAAAAAKAIREVDAAGTIGMISAEAYKPYTRPALSKSLWHGKPEKSIYMGLPQSDFDLFTGTNVVSLDAQQKLLTDEQGTTYGYKKLLFATGGTPRKLEGAPEEIVYYRTLDDFHVIKGWIGKGGRIGIIGAGFIGSEIAASLVELGERVVMVYMEEAVGVRVYPRDLSDYLTKYYQQKGVQLVPRFELQGVEKRGGKLIMRAKDGAEVEVEHVIAGLGILPNIALAQSAGAVIAAREGGGGIQVDEFMQTNLPGVYAAGDVASFFNHVQQRQMRAEHEDNALSMGRAAGLNMAGRKTHYLHQPFFYSDMFDLGYNAVGELDARLETFSDWVEPYRKGVVYYLKEQKVRGVLLWNVWGQLDYARDLIEEDLPHTAKDLKGRIAE